MVLLLLQQHGLGLVHEYSLEFLQFKTFSFSDESEGDEQLQYLMDLRSVVVIKHVGVGT
jgi:hypothetical protein